MTPGTASRCPAAAAVDDEATLEGDALLARLVGPYIGHLGSEALKLRLLPRVVSGETILVVAMTEPGAGSDVAGMKSRAARDGVDWVLNGSKTYISNGINGGAFVVAARAHGVEVTNTPGVLTDATAEEVAAIAAAVEVAWPRGGAAPPPEPPPRWRFSGRWWTKPAIGE